MGRTKAEATQVSGIQRLSSVRPTDLKGTLAFSVFLEDSDPHECGPMVVIVDPDGFTVRTPENLSPSKWTMTWKELMDMCRACEMEDAAERMENATRTLETELARQRELRGEQANGAVVSIDSVRRER